MPRKSGKTTKRNGRTANGGRQQEADASRSPVVAAALVSVGEVRSRDRIFADIAVALEPPVFVPALDWCPANLCIPSETESPGRFNLELMPHVAEVLRLANDPTVRRIILRWAHRTSKTFTGLSLQIYWLRTSFLPQVLAGSDKANTRDTRDELYRYLEASGFGELLLPPHARSERFIQVGSRRLKIRNAGSKTDLSGYAACFGHAVEFSKSGWLTRKSTEASSPKRFSKRFTGFPFDSKQILEGTPSLKDECNVSAETMKASTQRRYRVVPCPHCGTFQQLQFSPEFGNHKTAGIKWDKQNGRDVASVAAATAWYECVNGCKIVNFDRAEMMRRGVWLAEGQSIQNYKPDARASDSPDARESDALARASGLYITGKPDVDSDDIALDELSTLYSLLISGWGQIAAEWIKVNDKSDPEGVRSFVNEWLARIYDPKPPTITFQDIAKRLMSPLPLRKVPAWARFLVWSCDVGSRPLWNDEQRVFVDTPLFWWMVTAFGPHVRCQPIDFNCAKGEAELRQARATCEFSLENSVQLCRPSLGAIDCGYRLRTQKPAAREDDLSGALTYYLYDLCDALSEADETQPCLALHGVTKSNQDLFTWDYRISGQLPSDVARKRKWQDGDLLGINTHVTQSWIESKIRGIQSRSASECLDLGALTLPRELCDHANHAEAIGFLNQLAAEFFDGSRWISTGKHEWRDTLRYARALAEVVITSHGATWDNPPNLFERSPVVAQDDEEDWIHARQNWGPR